MLARLNWEPWQKAIQTQGELDKEFTAASLCGPPWSPFNNKSPNTLDSRCWESGDFQNTLSHSHVRECAGR